MPSHIGLHGSQSEVSVSETFRDCQYDCWPGRWTQWPLPCGSGSGKPSALSAFDLRPWTLSQLAIRSHNKLVSENTSLTHQTKNLQLVSDNLVCGRTIQRCSLSSYLSLLSRQPSAHPHLRWLSLSLQSLILEKGLLQSVACHFSAVFNCGSEVVDEGSCISEPNYRSALQSRSDRHKP